MKLPHGVLLALMVSVALLPVDLRAQTQSQAGAMQKAEVIASTPTIPLFATSEGGRSGEIERSQFPSEVLYLETAPNGRYLVRLPGHGDVWIMARHVRLANVDQRNVSCNSNLVASVVKGGRGSGERCKP